MNEETSNILNGEEVIVECSTCGEEWYEIAISTGEINCDLDCCRKCR